jgi:hypothetical protein
MAKAVNTFVDLYQSTGESVDNSDFRTPKGTCVRTNALDAGAFMDEFSNVLGSHMKVKPSAIPYLRAWLDQAFEIHCKLKGYKCEQVAEQRVLWSGHFSPAHQDLVAGSGDESMDVSASSEDKVLERVAEFKRKLQEARQHAQDTRDYSSPKMVALIEEMRNDALLSLLMETFNGFENDMANAETSRV